MSARASRLGVEDFSLLIGKEADRVSLLLGVCEVCDLLPVRGNFLEFEVDHRLRIG